MLRDGPYPRWLQGRIAGRYGHLDNGQAADLLASLDRGRLQWVMAGHLSEKNNDRARVQGALGAAVGREAPPPIHVLDATGDAAWHVLE